MDVRLIAYNKNADNNMARDLLSFVVAAPFVCKGSSVVLAVLTLVSLLPVSFCVVCVCLYRCPRPCPWVPWYVCALVSDALPRCVLLE